MPLSEFYRTLKVRSDDRYDKFAIEPTSSIRRIYEEAYLEKPTWLGGDEKFVCLFIDLDNSSVMSFKRYPKTMAQVYDYFTQNAVDIVTADPHAADYVDIKGDGLFGIYEGDKAVFKALAAALTFKTFFEKHVRGKFQTSSDAFSCKIAIDKDKVLVKKIGKRGDHNEVWAGRVVNNAAKLASLSREIQVLHGPPPNVGGLILLSDVVYNELTQKRDYAITSCGHDVSGNTAGKIPLWTQWDCANNDSINGDCAWYCSALWCDICGDRFMSEMLK